MQFEPVLRIEKKRLSAKTSSGITVNLDKIKGLGSFVEFEIIADNTDGCLAALESCAKKLGLSLSEEIGEGYVQLMLRKVKA